MSLTNDLISQFAKITKDTKNTNSESTVYGTVVEYSNSLFVRIDGSDYLTPVTTTAGIKVGERVTVMIKNHSATVTGNITSPSASGNDVQGAIDKAESASNKISEFEIIITDRITAEEFNAQVGRIDTLYSDNVTIKQTLAANNASIRDLEVETLSITDRLSANEADIDDLNAHKLSVEVANATYATISDLEATDADIYNLRATYGDFQVATASRFDAVDATIKNLDVKYATISDLDVERARIDILEAGALYADSAVIKALQADIADIDTLMFGSASGNVIQSSFSNAVIAALGNAQIKSAMIESVSADKITAGDIITNKVRVMSEDGLLLISDGTIQISDEDRVRVQIGKDSSGDYSINIWDADGKLMFSEGGITDSAIKKAIIRDDMVSDTANISAHKLNIASLFEEINNGVHTIKSSKVMVDSEGQTLDVVFTDMSTEVKSLQETVSSHGTELSVVQGQINTKVWQQDITTAVGNLEIGGRNLFGFHKGVGVGPVLSNISTVTKNEEVYGATITVNEEYNGNLLRISQLGFSVVNLGEEPFTFSAIAYASIDECNIGMDICDRNHAYFTLSTIPQKIIFTMYPKSYCTEDDQYYNGFVDLSGLNLPVGTVIYLEKIKIERGTKATDFTVAPEDLEYITDNLETKTSTLSTRYSSLEQTVDGISATVANHTTDILEKANESDVAIVEERIAEMNLDLDEFKTVVSATYATKNDVDGVNSKVLLNESSIEQNTKAIELRATKTELSNAFNELDVGGRNLVLNTKERLEIPETDGFTSTQNYKTYKLSPIISNDLKAFLLSLKNGKSLTISFDVNLPRVYKDNSLALSRLGVYMAVTFKHTNGTNLQWYCTHSNEPIKTNRHTIDSIGVNSLESLTETEECFVGRYSCYVTPSKSYATLLQNFYTNPDDYTLSTGGISVEFGGFTTGGYIGNIKMELGNKATDWTPAPEDLETRVDKAEASITVNTEAITGVVSRTTENEKAISILEQTASGITSRVSIAEETISNNTALATNAQTTADNAQTIASKAQTDIDDLEIGGRNLARNTSNAISYTVTTETGTDAYSKCDSYVRHGIFLEQGQTYTLSYDYEFDWGDAPKPTSAAGIGAGIGSDDGNNLPGSYFADSFLMVADYWTYGDGGYDSGRFVYTFTNNKSKDLYFAFRMVRSYSYGATVNITGVSLTVSNFKVEIGNRATDWSPAPEDMATSDELATVQSSAELTDERLSTAESLIQQLSHTISMLVTDANGESLMVQTADGWTFSTAELQNIVDTTSENLNDLTDKMGDVDSTVDTLKQAVTDLGILNEYVKITTYENEPCIELGENDSDFKLLITNTRIMFMEGSSVPAYINNQSLFIKKAVIEEELEQGEFIWKARSNGNLGLIWKGATS